MMSCMKTLSKVPMAAVGLIDLMICAADKTILSLAKRGEKAAGKMREKLHKPMKQCCCEEMEHP